jgi:hypothetical protein
LWYSLLSRSLGRRFRRKPRIRSAESLTHLRAMTIGWRSIRTISLGVRCDLCWTSVLQLLTLQIEPSRKIVYHDCFDDLQCARLLLPLDWSAGTSTKLAVAVALIRRPAKVNVTDPRYGGALIFNPGKSMLRLDTTVADKFRWACRIWRRYSDTCGRAAPEHHRCRNQPHTRLSYPAT